VKVMGMVLFLEKVVLLFWCCICLGRLMLMIRVFWV